MEKKSMITPRTPPYRAGVSGEGSLGAPILNLCQPNPDKEKEPDHVDIFVEAMFAKLPGPTPTSGNNPKKRKKDRVTTESPTEYKLLGDRVSQLEELVNSLITSSKARDVMEKEATTHATDAAFMDTDLDTAGLDIISGLNNSTKDTRSAFYKLYGQMKTIKSSFPQEQLKNRLTDQDFITFKDTRSKLTEWLKTGLALSRQLEELKAPTLEPTPPLLTIRSLAAMFNPEYDEFLRNFEQQKISLLRQVITEANSRLLGLNAELCALTTNTVDSKGKLILAKAFKAATQASSYLFKSKVGDQNQINRNNPEAVYWTGDGDHTNFPPLTIKDPVTSANQFPSTKQLYSQASSRSRPTIARTQPIKERAGYTYSTQYEQRRGLNNRQHYTRRDMRRDVGTEQLMSAHTQHQSTLPSHSRDCASPCPTIQTARPSNPILQKEPDRIADNIANTQTITLQDSSHPPNLNHTTNRKA